MSYYARESTQRSIDYMDRAGVWNVVVEVITRLFLLILLRKSTRRSRVDGECFCMNGSNRFTCLNDNGR